MGSIPEEGPDLYPHATTQNKLLPSPGSKKKSQIQKIKNKRRILLRRNWITSGESGVVWKAVYWIFFYRLFQRVIGVHYWGGRTKWRAWQRWYSSKLGPLSRCGGMDGLTCFPTWMEWFKVIWSCQHASSASPCSMSSFHFLSWKFGAWTEYCCRPRQALETSFCVCSRVCSSVLTLCCSLR